MALPTQKTPPRDSMSDLTILIYGASKIGKSTLCSNADHALFLATEAGLNSLDVFQQPILTWPDLVAAVDEIAKGNHPFKTIVLDIADNAYKMCADFVCRKNNIQHESDLGYGKGFSLVNNEFQRILTKLSLLPYGLYLISHAQDKEIDTPTGKRIKTLPTLPGKAREIVLGMADIILYCDIEVDVTPDGKKAERRVMRTKPSALYEAGDRTKRLPETIPLDYAAFVEAYKAGTSTPDPNPAPASATPTQATGTPAASAVSRATQPRAQGAAQPVAQGAKAPTNSTTTQAPEVAQPGPTAGTVASPSPQDSHGAGPATESPASTSDLPPEFVEAMVELAEVTLGMPTDTRKALIADFEKEGPTSLPALLEEIAKLKPLLVPPLSPQEAGEFAEDVAQGPAGQDALPPDLDEANGGISGTQYEALNTLIKAFGLNRDALRAFSAKAGHLLPGAHGPTLARMKAGEFIKLREKLCNDKIATGNETWSQRTVRIINATPTTAYSPVAAAS